MKRRPAIIGLIFALILFLESCSAKSPASPSAAPSGTGLPKAGAVLSGKIMGMNDGTFLLAGTGGADLYMVSSETEIFDKDENFADGSALKAGMTVEIGYSGTVLESYPAQLGTPSYIKITDQGDDLVGFYREILNDLWSMDEGLNSDLSVLAFDLSQVTNLTDAEKSALVYLVSGEHNAAGVTGTFDELCEQGYIDKEKLFFKTGLFFELELSDVTEDSFTFTVSKWRSGNGAYIFHECKAQKASAGWSYSIGSEMIS
ncbi:hypothetical protein SDC9_46794 [bioreactor metagenome]|uniref:Uncharacterized protein n=1 Tax=bioreactor metagenome TaxID=1076179 RepID=A0A644WAN1_9ZZZZ